MDVHGLVMLLPRPFDDECRVPGNVRLLRSVAVIRHGLRTPLHKVDENRSKKKDAFVC